MFYFVTVRLGVLPDNTGLEYAYIYDIYYASFGGADVTLAMTQNLNSEPSFDSSCIEIMPNETDPCILLMCNAFE